MGAPSMKVKCNVSSCAYYENNYCTAKALEINPMNDSKAYKSEDTCCTTFIPES